MSEKYLPFFRKYRPQAFCDLVGQESLVKALTNAIELNRFANAYLFCGPRGTGKTSSARIFAKSLNCECGPTTKPCQKCSSCVDITNSSGLDVIEIDAATNRGIDDAKELISQVQYAPINGKYKIFIIDEVHMLSKEAFNALLKTFEEPPSNVIFILATTEPHKVIETIVSRCQRFDFRRITIDDIVKKLREVSELEKIKITDEALLTIAKNVSGGLRDSLALLDQVAILGAKEEITKDLIENLIGKITFEPLFELTNSIVENNVENTLLLIEKIYQKGCEPRNFVENYIEFLRNTSIVLNSNNALDVCKFTSFNKGDVEKIKNSNYKKDDILLYINKAIEFYKEVKSTTNPYLWVELMLIEMCGLGILKDVSKTVSVNMPIVQTLKASNDTEKALENAAIKQEIRQEPIQNTVEENTIEPEIKKEDPKEPAEAKEAEIDTEACAQAEVEENAPKEQPTNQSQSTTPVNMSVIDIWSEIVSSIKSPFAMSLFKDLPQSVEIVEDRIIVGFIHPNAITQAKAKSQFLEEAVKSVLNKPYEIVFKQVEKGEKMQLVKPQAPKPRPMMVEAEKSYSPEPKKTEEKQDDEIEIRTYSDRAKMLLDTFNGKIVD